MCISVTILEQRVAKVFIYEIKKKMYYFLSDPSSLYISHRVVTLNSRAFRHEVRSRNSVRIDKSGDISIRPVLLITVTRVKLKKKRKEIENT